MKCPSTISKLTLEEKCYLLSGKDFWKTRSVKAKGIRKQECWDRSNGVIRFPDGPEDLVFCFSRLS